MARGSVGGSGEKKRDGDAQCSGRYLTHPGWLSFMEVKQQSKPLVLQNPPGLLCIGERKGADTDDRRKAHQVRIGRDGGGERGIVTNETRNEFLFFFLGFHTKHES